jgi:hypothetical protein
MTCESLDFTWQIALSDELPTVRCASKARFPVAELQLGPMRSRSPTDFSNLSKRAFFSLLNPGSPFIAASGPIYGVARRTLIQDRKVFNSDKGSFGPWGDREQSLRVTWQVQGNNELGLRLPSDLDQSSRSTSIVDRIRRAHRVPAMVAIALRSNEILRWICEVFSSKANSGP